MALPEIRIEEPVRFSFHCLNFLCLVPEYVPILVFHYREFVDVFKCGPDLCDSKTRRGAAFFCLVLQGFSSFSQERIRLK